MHHFPSNLAASVPRSRIREIAELAASVREPLSLYFGESSVPTPTFIRDAAKRGIDNGCTFYTHNAGYLDLRTAIAGQVSRLHGLAYEADGEVIVTAGGVAGIFLSLYATLEPGSRAVIISPCWPNVAAAVGMVGATPVEVPLRRDGGRFRLDREAVAAALDPSARVLFVNSPSNPTGWVMSSDDEAFLVQIAEDRGAFLILDQVYERIVFETSAAAPASHAQHPSSSISISSSSSDPSARSPEDRGRDRDRDRGRGEEGEEGEGPSARPAGRLVAPLRHIGRDGERHLLLNSFSKAYAMTGWRVGYACGPRPIIAQMTKLQEFIVSHCPAPSQRAAIAAIEEGEEFVRQSLRRYRALRDLACERLSRCPRVELEPPEGSFYLFPRIAGLTDSFELCRRLLLETGVGLAPGCAFGPGGEGHVRICFAVEEEILAPALDRLVRFLSRNG